MSSLVSIVNGLLISKGRPAFLSSTNKALPVQKGQDRRHILHGAVQITDVLIKAFNWIISKHGFITCMNIVDQYLILYKTTGMRFNIPASEKDRIRKLITIAFGNPRNLVVGSSVCNQGIEKARSSIVGINCKLNEYCIELRSFQEIKSRATQLINNVLKGGSGAISKHRLWILNILKNTVKASMNVLALNYALQDFKFSCTLDVCHDGTTKIQNIWGLNMANNLQKTIVDKDTNGIFKILL
jgi:hypothetical protein